MELCQWKEVPLCFVNVATERTRHCRGGFEHGAASESASCVAPAAGLGVRSPRQARRYWALPHRVSDPKTPRKRCKRAAGGQRHGMGHRGLLCLIAVQVKPFRREAHGDFGWTPDMSDPIKNFDAINSYVGNWTQKGGKIDFFMTAGDNIYVKNEEYPTD